MRDCGSNSSNSSLRRVCLVRRINRSSKSLYHGALDKLNFHMISLQKKLWNVSFLLVLDIHLAPALNIFELSEYIIFRLLRLAINFFKLLVAPGSLSSCFLNFSYTKSSDFSCFPQYRSNLKYSVFCNHALIFD